ncbi:hypothetical protein BDR26DRAFT_874080 [Obelidium mucronatum]|nr:hypothetical protein BDR26DRAFT_874080 [Obelidium mucronatum]
MVIKAAVAATKNGESMGFDACFNPSADVSTSLVKNPSIHAGVECIRLQEEDQDDSNNSTSNYDMSMSESAQNALETASSTGSIDDLNILDEVSMQIPSSDQKPRSRANSGANSIAGDTKKEKNPASIPAFTVRKPVVIPLGLPGSAIGTDSLNSPVSSIIDDTDVSDIESSPTGAGLAPAQEGGPAAAPASLASSSAYAPPIKPANPMFVTQPVRRGRGRGSYKTLLNTHKPSVSSDSLDNNGTKRKRGAGGDEDNEETAAEEDGGGREEINLLQVHYLVRPLPIASGRERLNRDGTVPELFPEDEESAGDYQSKDDVSWNVACLQALDIAASWGVPKNADQEYSDQDETGVWGDVIQSMNLPFRPDECIPTNTAWTGGTTVTNLNKSPRKPMSLKIPTTLNPLLDAWGLDRDSASVKSLIHHVRQSNWCGNDKSETPELAHGERFIRRFRLGTEVIQVGDLVRLSGRGTGRGVFGRVASRKALVIHKKEDLEKFMSEQKRKFERPPGCTSPVLSVSNELFGGGFVKDAGKYRVFGKEESDAESFVLKFDDSFKASVEPLVVEAFKQEAEAEEPQSQNPPFDPESVYGMTLPSTDGPAPIPLDIPALAENFPRKTVRPSILLVGRVFNRIPSDGRASRHVPLWFPTGEVRTANPCAGEVLCRVHSQFPSATLTGVSASGGTSGWTVVHGFGTTTTSYQINVGGVGFGWKGAGGVEESTFSGIRLHRDEILRGKIDVE